MKIIIFCITFISFTCFGTERFLFTSKIINEDVTIQISLPDRGSVEELTNMSNLTQPINL